MVCTVCLKMLRCKDNILQFCWKWIISKCSLFTSFQANWCPFCSHYVKTHLLISLYVCVIRTVYIINQNNCQLLNKHLSKKLWIVTEGLNCSYFQIDHARCSVWVSTTSVQHLLSTDRQMCGQCHSERSRGHSAIPSVSQTSTVWAHHDFFLCGTQFK